MTVLTKHQTPAMIYTVD